MRLTEKTNNGYKLKIDNLTWVSNKLGQLEDLMSIYNFETTNELLEALDLYKAIQEVYNIIKNRRK